MLHTETMYEQVQKTVFTTKDFQTNPSIIHMPYIYAYICVPMLLGSPFLPVKQKAACTL